MLRFHYQSIALKALSPEGVIRTGLTGLLPLLLLTKNGARREIVEAMFSRLLAAKKIELVPIGYTLTSLAFSRENPVRRTGCLGGFTRCMIFCERLPSLKRFYKEGREEGLEQGRQRGRLEALRQAIVEVVVERFPQFVRLTKEQVALIEDPDVLRHVLVKGSVALSAEKTKKHLLAINEAKEQS